MGIKIKNLQTGEFEKFNIPALKGEKGEPGEIELSEKVDYIGKQHSKLRDTMNANVDYIIKTAIGEFNYLDYEGQQITATNTLEGHAKSAILKGNTLVNILNGEVRGSINQRFFDYLIDIPFKDNQVYTAIFNVSTEATKLTCGLLKKTDEIGGIDWNGQPLPYVNGYNKVLLTPVSNSAHGLRIRYFDDIVATFEPSNVMLIEGDYTNVDIPYFEGMTSVRMPVLKTTGKNLFDYKSYTNGEGLVQIENGFRVTSWAYKKPFKNFLKPNTWYQSSYLYNIIRPSVGATDDGGGKLAIGNGSKYILITGIKGANFSFRTPRKYRNIL